MYLKIMHCYRRSTYRQYIKINTVIRPYSYIPDNEKNNVSSQIIKSAKFPEHQIVYAFPYITPLRFLNAVKYNAAVLTGASIPIIIALQLSGFMSGEETIDLIFNILICNGWYHAICWKFNNFIGSIYFKKDNQEVIISYVNYWGKRIDMKTNIESVIPLTETRRNMLHFLYRYLNVTSCKRKLKISIQYGKVVEPTVFEYIVGNIL